MAIQAHATAKYVRTSAQKAGLVLDLIRGRDVNAALSTLRFARKGVARDIEKVLRSAVSNAQQKEGFGGDVDRLYVNACYANQGPSQKRIRPAPMGRAFRVVKRTAHLTVHVAERPSAVLEEAPTPSAPEKQETQTATPSTPKRPRGAKPKPKAKARGARKAAGTRKKSAGGGKKKTAGGRAKKAGK
jgi:large subunit ribosomal protein L22